MKKIGRFICFTTLFLLIAGCKQQKTIRYELVDGNPQIDYIDFLNDTLCRFVAPGPLVLTSHYTKEGLRSQAVSQKMPLPATARALMPFSRF